MTKARRERRGEGSLHQRPNGTWCVQIDLGPSVDGKRRRKTVYAKTPAEAIKKRDALRRQLDDNGDLPTSDVPLARWLDDWLTRIAANRVKPATLRSYRTAVNCHIKPAIGKIRLSRLGVAHIRRMHTDVSSRLSTTTAHNAHRVLSAALADAVLEGRVGRNIAAVVPAPSKAESERLGLSAASAMSLLRAAPEARWMFALLTGARQGERLGLRWDHVDLDAGVADLAWALTRVSYAHGCSGTCGLTPRRCPARMLPVPKSMRHVPLAGNLVLMSPKTRGSKRIVPLVPPLVEALRRQQEITGASRHGLVWCDPDGDPIDPKDDWVDWHAALTKAGLPKVTLHEARHTTATLLMELGVERRIISEVLGHSQAVTTDGYKHVAVDLSRNALDGLARHLELTGASATS